LKYNKEVDRRNTSVKKQPEAGALKQENERRQRFIVSIPLDMMSALKEQ
jgi:hypothetical protein